MSTTYRNGLGLSLAGIAIALGGCAMIERMTTSATTTGTEAPTAASMGGGSSPYVRAALEPFSLANCAKFEALPQECERALLRGE